MTEKPKRWIVTGDYLRHLAKTNEYGSLPLDVVAAVVFALLSDVQRYAHSGGESPFPYHHQANIPDHDTKLIVDVHLDVESNRYDQQLLLQLHYWLLRNGVHSPYTVNTFNHTQNDTR